MLDFILSISLLRCCLVFQFVVVGAVVCVFFKKEGDLGIVSWDAVFGFGTDIGGGQEQFFGGDMGDFVFVSDIGLVDIVIFKVDMVGDMGADSGVFSVDIVIDYCVVEEDLFKICESISYVGEGLNYLDGFFE